MARARSRKDMIAFAREMIARVTEIILSGLNKIEPKTAVEHQSCLKLSEVFVRTACGIYRLCYPAVSVRSMKNFCSILVAVVMVTHLHCGASCLTESVGKAAQMPVTTEPPCHQHTNVPIDRLDHPEAHLGPTVV